MPKKIYRFANGTWKQVASLPSFPKHIVATGNGEVWVQRFYPDGFSRYEGRTWTHYPRDNFKDLGYTQTLAATEQGTWVIFSKGFVYHDGRNWHRFENQDLPNLYKGGIESCRGTINEVWCVTSKGTLIHFDRGSESWSTRNLTLSLKGTSWEPEASPRIRLDRRGTIWLFNKRVWRQENDSWVEMQFNNVSFNDVQSLGFTDSDLYLLDEKEKIFSISLDGATVKEVKKQKLRIENDNKIFALGSVDDALTVISDKHLFRSSSTGWAKSDFNSEVVKGRSDLKISDGTVLNDGSIWVSVGIQKRRQRILNAVH